MLAILRALRATRAKATVWRLGGGSDIESDFRDLGVDVLGGSTSAWRGVWQGLPLFKYIWRERVALIQTLLFHSDITGRIVGRSARLCRRNSGVPIIISSVRASNLRNAPWQFALQRLTAPMADAFTAVSKRTMEFAAEHEGVARARTTVIPNGIDLSEQRTISDAASARAQLGLPTEAFVIGTVGRLCEQKGHTFLLSAAKKLLAERPDAMFVIAGYGPSEEQLKTQADDLGIGSSVKFLGYRRDVDLVLAALDVFVLPSLWEGMSNAILEAMAAAKPVLATAVDGNLEQVVRDETGILVPPGDADALAEALLGLAGDPQRALDMGRRGRERVEREFPQRRTTAAYIDLYARLLEKAGISADTWR